MIPSPVGFPSESKAPKLSLTSNTGSSKNGSNGFDADALPVTKGVKLRVGP